MFNGQVLFLAMVVVGMLSLPVALAWAVLDNWVHERRQARPAVILAAVPVRAQASVAGR